MRNKQEKRDRKLAELLDMPYEEVLKKRKEMATDDEVREVQAVHLFLDEQPDLFIPKICGWCKQTFLTSYQFVSYCSTTCRIKSLEEIGIEYDPTVTSSERWRLRKIPTEYSIPPEALKVLKTLASLNPPNTS